MLEKITHTLTHHMSDFFFAVSFDFHLQEGSNDVGTCPAFDGEYHIAPPASRFYLGSYLTSWLKLNPHALTQK